MSGNIFEELKWRGMIYDHTELIPELLANEKIKLYIGFDPTAASLHVGNLVPMMALARFQRFGHTPIALAGGGTGMIGDPSGRSSERNLLSPEKLAENLAGIKKQLAHVLDFEVEGNTAQIVNNADWLGEINILDFLRDVGKQFSVNVMMSKESIKSRIEGGISFTEFSYMLLQAYDFLHLYRAEGCVLQCGGSDQWGNITAGTDLIRREGGKAHALVYPLITKSDGTKFGKSAGGSIWLDPNLTSPYRFFQFWINTSDEDAVSYLKIFTWMTQDEINALEQEHQEAPHRRLAQKRLAQEVTRMIHGQDALDRAERATAVLFGGSLEGLSAAEIADIFTDVPSTELAHSEIANGISVIDLLAGSGAASGKGDARRSVQGGGMYLNNEKIADAGQTVTLDDAIEGQFLVLRKGKRKYHLVKITA